MPTGIEIFLLEWWWKSPLGVKGKHREEKPSMKECGSMAFYGRKRRTGALFGYLVAKNKVYGIREEKKYS
jgi:hypothetical protein